MLLGRSLPITGAYLTTISPVVDHWLKQDISVQIWLQI